MISSRLFTIPSPSLSSLSKIALSCLRCWIVFVDDDDCFDTRDLRFFLALLVDGFAELCFNDDDLIEIVVEHVPACARGAATFFRLLFIIDRSFIRDGGDDTFVDALWPGEEGDARRTTRLVAGDAESFLLFFFFFFFFCPDPDSLAATAASTALTKAFDAVL